jgi:tetratricopeptide (TPR) repeat protein
MMQNGDLLSDSTATAMLTPQIDVDSGVTWGLGIGLQDDETGRGFWHWGDNTGYKAYTLTYPERGVGMIWFTNSENGHTILQSLLDHTVGGEHPAAAWLGYEQYNSPTREVRETVWQNIEENGLAAGIRRYHELKQIYPPEGFDEFVLNSLGYRLLLAERYDDAIAIFRLNIEEYPDAWNPYDSLGEAYMRAGDLESAIGFYERSLELNPDNTGGKAMLERIRAQLGGR